MSVHNFTHAGRRFSFSSEEVVSAFRAVLVNGAPPPEASQFKSWAVQVDGHLVGARWLFRLITGLPALTTTARRHLEALGFSEIHVSESPTPSSNPRPVNRSSDNEQRRWAEIVAQEVKQIRAFLHGHSYDQPPAERLCEWVFFCYQFELYAEGAGLFSHISFESVNPWLYDRAKRLARVCSLKANAS